MSYILDSNTIRRPKTLREENSTQAAQNRTLKGTITRDLFGSNKRIWILSYENITKAEYNLINSIYQSYLSTGNPKSFQVTETNYTISSVNVHVDLLTRQFRVGGTDYISDFTLILTEA